MPEERKDAGNEVRVDVGFEKSLSDRADLFVRVGQERDELRSVEPDVQIGVSGTGTWFRLYGSGHYGPSHAAQESLDQHTALREPNCRSHFSIQTAPGGITFVIRTPSFFLAASLLDR